MEITKKVCKIGHSLAIFLPKIWIDSVEGKNLKIHAVSMTVNGKLIIRPLLKEAAQYQKNV